MSKGAAGPKNSGQLKTMRGKPNSYVALVDDVLVRDLQNETVVLTCVALRTTAASRTVSVGRPT